MGKLHICFVGTGWMGSAQIKQLSTMSDVDISVVVNDDIDQAENVLHNIGLTAVPVTTDYKKAIIDYPVDVVWIVSPNSFHGFQAIYAMEHGKHVFCEKPPATSFIEFEKEIALVENNKSICSLVNYILYFNPMEQSLINLAKADLFGTIQQIQVNYRHKVNITGNKKWKLNKETVGDALGMGINHAISVIILIMSTQSNPSAVYACSRNGGVRGFEVDPVWTVLIRFENGAVATCCGNIDNENGYDLYHNIAGTKGGFIFDSRVAFSEKIRIWGDELTNGEWIYPLREDTGKKHPLLDDFSSAMLLPDSGNVTDHQTKDALEHFIHSVQSGEETELSFSNSAVIGEIGWAAQLSALTHREVLLPLREEDRIQLRKL